ncbi:MAG: RodZ domain-containing protein, partial [Candidatus Limnocylindria bacterium]
NVVTLVATDPLTNRDSEPVRRTIIVGDEAPSPTPGTALALAAPEEGASLAGPVELAGSAAPGSGLTLTATFVSPAPATIRVVTLAGQDVPLPPAQPAAPEPLALTADADGSFSGSLGLPPGTWDLHLAVDGGAGEPITRRVSVTPPAGLSGRLSVTGSQSYLEIDEDGVPKADVSGRNAQPGAEVPLAAQQSLRIRVGNAGAVRLFVNGVDLGTMGGSGAVVEWRVTRI